MHSPPNSADSTQGPTKAARLLHWDIDYAIGSSGNMLWLIRGQLTLGDPYYVIFMVRRIGQTAAPS